MSSRDLIKTLPNSAPTMDLVKVYAETEEITKPGGVEYELTGDVVVYKPPDPPLGRGIHSTALKTARAVYWPVVEVIGDPPIEIDPTAGTLCEEFVAAGYTVAIGAGSSWIFLGAPGWDRPMTSFSDDTGKVFAVKLNSENRFEKVDDITPPTAWGTPKDFLFGWSIAVDDSGTLLAVGCRDHTEIALYTLNATTDSWEELQSIETEPYRPSRVFQIHGDYTARTARLVMSGVVRFSTGNSQKPGRSLVVLKVKADGTFPEIEGSELLTIIPSDNFQAFYGGKIGTDAFEWLQVAESDGTIRIISADPLFYEKGQFVDPTGPDSMFAVWSRPSDDVDAVVARSIRVTGGQIGQPTVTLGLSAGDVQTSALPSAETLGTPSIAIATGHTIAPTGIDASAVGAPSLADNVAGAWQHLYLDIDRYATSPSGLGDPVRHGTWDGHRYGFAAAQRELLWCGRWIKDTDVDAPYLQRYVWNPATHRYDRDWIIVANPPLANAPPSSGRFTQIYQNRAVAPVHGQTNFFLDWTVAIDPVTLRFAYAEPGRYIQADSVAGVPPPPYNIQPREHRMVHVLRFNADGSPHYIEGIPDPRRRWESSDDASPQILVGETGFGKTIAFFSDLLVVGMPDYLHEDALNLGGAGAGTTGQCNVYRIRTPGHL